jgi:hypothetical protein
VSETWQHIFVTNCITECTSLSAKTKESTHIVPLYIYEKKTIFEHKIAKTNKQLEKEYFEAEQHFEKAWNEYQTEINDKSKENYVIEEYLAKVEEHKAVLEILKNKRKLEQAEIENSDFIKIPNFSTKFMEYVKDIYTEEISPEQIFYYIYAVLHSPTYRKKYADFLKIDFPKIPFTNNLKLFIQISELGQKICNAHLFDNETIKEISKTYKTGEFKGQGNFIIEKVQYIGNQLFINEGQYFSNVPENIYNFQIGGYQILYKHLKDCKEQTLKLNDIEKIEKIICVIEFTIDKMKEIDDLFNDLNINKIKEHNEKL